MFRYCLNSAFAKRSNQVKWNWLSFFGEEALLFMNEHEHEAVLILSDINMPGMSGLELLQHIKEKYEKPPPVVMMITAYGDDENYNQAMKLGAAIFNQTS